jgi:hypothetical protein
MKKLLCIIAGICLFSCNKNLDKLPLNAPSSESFPTNQAELQTALVGCNNPLLLSFGENPFAQVFEMFSDNAANRDLTSDQMWGDPAGGYVDAIWNNMYVGISRCNFLLDHMDQARKSVDEATIQNIGAQTRFLRAYYYSLLTAFFGDVPYITTTLDLSEANDARNDKAAIVDSIIAELDDASRYLTETNHPTSMTITKGAAWALESRVALYNQKWQAAIEAAKKVMAMEGSQYELDPHYEDLCKLAGNTSKEMIWSVHWNYSDITNIAPVSFKSRNAQGYNNRMPTESLVDSYQCIDGLTIDQSPLYDPKKPFDNRDPRLNWTIAVPGSVYCGYEYQTNKDSLTCWNYNVSPAVRISNQDAINPYASFSGFAWRKYVDSTEFGEGNKSAISTVLIRYAEVLLNYAEAKIESDQIDASVYEAINKVRRRARMPEIPAGKSQAELRSIVRMERKVEFAGEGLRYFDILRWRIAEQVLNGPCYGRIPTGLLSSAPKIDANGTPDYSSVSNHAQMRVIQVRNFDKAKNYVWPIPAIELQTNKNLVQNPGY